MLLVDIKSTYVLVRARVSRNWEQGLFCFVKQLLPRLLLVNWACGNFICKVINSALFHWARERTLLILIKIAACQASLCAYLRRVSCFLITWQTSIRYNLLIFHWLHTYSRKKSCKGWNLSTSNVMLISRTFVKETIVKEILKSCALVPTVN